MSRNSILVVGANRGIGLEIARQYSADGWRVFAACRSPEKASALNALAGDYRDTVSVHPLDVTNDKQIRSLADALSDQALDILFHCAGVYGQKDASFGNTDVDEWLQTLRINSLAPMKVMEAFVEHVARSDKKVIAGMTSKMGSMGDNGSGGSYVYRSSKAALNAVLKSAAMDLKERGITVIALHPGWVKTDMGGPNALITPEQSVKGLRAILDRATLEQSGMFFQYDGQVVPW